jgi:ubiquinone biosynthesis protein UbiJ
MLDAMKALAQRSAMERLVLLVNHVVAAEPAAVERLRPHAGRTMQLELAGWPSMLPAVGPFAFRVTPAGLVEWIETPSALPPDLRVAIDAANPAAAMARLLTGERPTISVSGDAAFAADLDWLIDNVRWDMQDDLARVIGEGPARALARLGGFVAAALRDTVRAVRDLAGRAPRRDPETPSR